MQFRLTKNGSSDIGSALACLQSGAIQFRKFKDWLHFVIEHSEDTPNYVFDMLDVELCVDFKPHRIMGWTSSEIPSDDELDAFAGIGYLRGIVDFEDGISRKQALQTLKNNDTLFQKVKAFFPFLVLEEEVGPDPDKGW